MARVLNYTHDTPTKLSIEGPLKMILWAGDCVHNGITDVERIPGYDIYLCMGFVNGIQANIDFISKRDSGHICIIDASSPEQMSRFILDYMGRFSLIDSDYHGNTPRLLPEYYSALLSADGKAYNIEGIGGLCIYRGDYVNALETFGPVLNEKLNAERRYTELMLQLASDNNLPVDMAWTSPDLDQPYYKDIKQWQKNFSENRKSLNPNHVIAIIMGEDRLEEYWSQLSDEIMCFSSLRAEHIAKMPLKELIGDTFWNRFCKYLTDKVEKFVGNLSEFREFADDFSKIQHVLKLSTVAKKFDGFTVNYGFYNDMRKHGNPRVYGLWISKPVVN
jgi:hypothetical protein